jgi:disulfide bond formation protein DsbB
MNKLLKLKNIYLLISAISIFTLLSAVYIEYILGVKPCILCLYQRVPYIIAIFFCFFGYYNLKNKLWIYLLVITFLISAILSGYHVGIENNVFNEFSGCTSNNSNIVNKDELLKALKETQPNCKDVTFKLLGFSLATINLFLSIIIIILSIKIIKNEKNR